MMRPYNLILRGINKLWYL